MNKKKEPLYIFLHIHKCAGTTIREHLLNSLKRNEVLLTYGNQPPYIIKKNQIEKYIKSLTKKQKNELKVIFGHRIFYGLHKFFPGREVRYVTFLRNPVDRTISHYKFRRMRLEQWRKLSDSERKEFVKQHMENKRRISHYKFRRMRLEQWRKLSDSEQKELVKQHMENKRFLNFEKWFFRNNKLSQNFIFRLLFNSFFNRKPKNKEINKKNLIKIKKILDKFYFIGIVENPEDFLFFYSKFKINTLYPNANVLKKHLSKKEMANINDLFSEKITFDEEIYEYTKKLNKQFKKINLNYKLAVMYVKLKIILLPSYRNIKKRAQLILPWIYKQSARLKKKLKIYAQFVEVVKNLF